MPQALCPDATLKDLRAKHATDAERVGSLWTKSRTRSPTWIPPPRAPTSSSARPSEVPWSFPYRGECHRGDYSMAPHVKKPNCLEIRGRLDAGLFQTPGKSLIVWSGREDSNFRPPAPHAGALPGCATPRTPRIIGTRPYPVNSVSVKNVSCALLPVTADLCCGVVT